MVEKFGVFGGTFDPPHIGHQILAAEALDQLGLNKVLWVLTPSPPHKQKQTVTHLAVRLKMVEAAISGNADFILSRVEIDRAAPHYSLDTINLLQAQFPGVKLIYLMGGDSLKDLPNWYASQKFVAACSALGVMHRPGYRIDLSWLETQIPGITQKVQFVETPLLDVSASQIRSRIRQGKPFRYFLPQAVYEIINTHHLYFEFS